MAHTKAKIEHRDVSVANLVIGEKDGVSRGLLIDWELARYQEDATPRTYEQIVCLETTLRISLRKFPEFF